MNYVNAMTISLSVLTLLLTLTTIVASQNQLETTYNKLTLKPNFSVLIFLSLLVVQCTIMELWPELQPPKVLAKRMIEGSKAFFCYYCVSVSLLEWRCLIFMIKFQASKKT